MKVSYRWLSEYVNLDGYTAEQLAAKLTESGIEVDFTEQRNRGVRDAVVGYVKEKRKHPDADKLNVCSVDVGTGQDLQIVCGAANVDAGQRVPVAVVGAELPDGVKIKRAKLRGVESQGMICSAKELGLPDRLLPKEQQEGILVLPSDSKLGEPIVDLLALDDEVMELELTPNRSDCLSMIGVAYEIAAILNREVTLPNEREYLRETDGAVDDRIRIRIDAPDQCKHYTARWLEGIVIADSPQWMKNRLMAAGMRPINNVVDITNYVMLEYGQPLHAFDANRLAEGRIVVRTAEAGETMTTLDGAVRTLESHMLLITDGSKPIALAGVMGGANSEVSATTTNVLLESARFDGGTVRKTSRQLGLRSESSLRFEKEVDPERVITALNRAAALMCQYAGASVSQGVAEAVAHESAPETRIEISTERINRLLGTSLSVQEIGDILNRLHFPYDVSGESFAIAVPSRRGDITRDVDIVEEVARLHGYNRIPTTWIEGATTPGALTPSQRGRRAIRHLLTGMGLDEAVNYSFTHPERIHMAPTLAKEAKPVRLAMPMSEDRSVLRTGLLAQMLETAAYNSNHKETDIAMFEIGRVFLTNEQSLTVLPREEDHLAVLWTGARCPFHWSTKRDAVDFYDVKGIADGVLQYLGLSDQVSYRAAVMDGLHPGRTAQIILTAAEGEQVLGYLGQIHPDLQRRYDLNETYVLEMNLELVYPRIHFDTSYRPIPRFPSVSRDIAVVVSQDMHADALLAAIRKAAGRLLESVRVFDIYAGEHLGPDSKSVAMALVYRHPEQTLTEEEITSVHQRVVQALALECGASLRK